MTTMQRDAAIDTPSLMLEYTHMLARVEALALEYSLSLNQFDQPDVLKEAQAVFVAGFAQSVIASCAVLFAASSAGIGWAISTGAFAWSRILVRCESALRDCGEQLLDGGAHSPDIEPPMHDEFAQWLWSPLAESPTLLVASPPSERLVEAVANALPDAEVSLDSAGEGQWQLRILPRRSLFEAAAPSGSSNTLEAPAGDTSLRLILSPLLSAIVEAKIFEADLRDRPMQMSCECAVPAQHLGKSEWLALLPDLPTPLKRAEVAEYTLAGLRQAWQDLFDRDRELDIHTRASLEVRSRLVWTLAATTERCPPAGMFGLLAVAPESVGTLVEAYAMHNDVELSEVIRRLESIERSGPALSNRKSELNMSAVPSEMSRTDDTTFISKSGTLIGSCTVRDVDADISLVSLDASGLIVAIVPRSMVLEIADTAWQERQANHAIQASVEGREFFVVPTDALAECQAPVEITVPLTGIRRDDIELIAAVHSILDRFPGRQSAHIALTRQADRKIVQRPADRGISHTPALEAEIARILGPNNLRIIQHGAAEAQPL